jgi:hypothetical protein
MQQGAPNAKKAWSTWRMLREDRKIALVETSFVELMLISTATDSTHLAFMAELLDSGLINHHEAVHGYNFLLRKFGGTALLFTGKAITCLTKTELTPSIPTYSYHPHELKGGAKQFIQTLHHFDQRGMVPNEETFEALQEVYCRYNKEANVHVCIWLEARNQNGRMREKQKQASSGQCTVQ